MVNIIDNYARTTTTKLAVRQYTYTNDFNTETGTYTATGMSADYTNIYRADFQTKSA